jgi:selenocysteine-specific elongation factor
MRVIGTAGHVDHGKSALILALTGINPDRLREEQERQMTIDLGFAWMTLEDGEEIGFVDVPGHRDFIENMLAGVGGLDAVLFVVAVDEGVMPQTKEHLSILDLLEVENGIIVITKMDLLEDESWLEMVKEDIQRLTEGSRLENASMVPVSVITGEGMDTMRERISEIVKCTPPRPDLGRARLPIDRVFTIAGFGTVVTGTLIDGSLTVGQEVEILPKALHGRIRGLQTHKSKVERAIPGSRTAVNISGIDVKDISRGDVLVMPGSYSTTRMLDVQYRHLMDAGSTLKHNQRVKLFIGTAQCMARVRVLDGETIEPGGEGWLQFVMDQAIVAARGDHFILRRPSPGATLGGGRIADAHPHRKHRRNDKQVIQRLEKSLRGTEGEKLAQSLLSLGPTTLRQAIQHAGIETVDAQEVINELLDAEELIQVSDGELKSDSSVIVSHRSTWDGLSKKVLTILEQYHHMNNLRFGMPKEEIKSRIKIDANLFSLLMKDLERKERIVNLGTKVALYGFRPELNEDETQQISSLMAKFMKTPFSPPSIKECISQVGNELYEYLLESDQLVRVSSEVVFLKSTYDEMVQKIVEELQKRKTLSVAEVRDLFGTSRKFALGIMEYLDAIGITVRKGDVRELVGTMR